MISTLTPNPSFDRTLRVDHLQRGGVIRASSVRVECSGKGVNVARALARNGHVVQAVLPACAEEAAAFEASLAAEGSSARTVPIRGRIRSCFTLVEPDGTATQINEPGPNLSSSEADELAAAAASAAEDSDWLIASGSLPPGSPPDLYARVATVMNQDACSLAVDTSGEALRSMVGRPCAVVKPNLDELAGIAGRRPRTVGEVIDLAEGLRGDAWGAVLVSMGAAGALLVAEEPCFATATATRVRNTVGAGDALLAGFVSAGGQGAAALAEGVAWACAAVKSENTLGCAVTSQDRSNVKVTSNVPSQLAVDV